METKQSRKSFRYRNPRRVETSPQNKGFGGGPSLPHSIHKLRSAPRGPAKGKK